MALPYSIHTILRFTVALALAGIGLVLLVAPKLLVREELMIPKWVPIVIGSVLLLRGLMRFALMLRAKKLKDMQERLDEAKDNAQ